jgi:hypothetical protein
MSTILYIHSMYSVDFTRTILWISVRVERRKRVQSLQHCKEKKDCATLTLVRFTQVNFSKDCATGLTWVGGRITTEDEQQLGTAIRLRSINSPTQVKPT